jgi:hypothetical protein
MYLFFTEDDSVQISLSEPSPFKGFLLKPSSLKAPSIRLPQSKATHEEPAESIVLTGFKTHSTPDSNVFGRLGSGKSEPSDQNSDLPSNSSTSSRIFGSNLTEVLSIPVTTTTDPSTSVTSVFGSGLKDRAVTSISPRKEADSSTSVFGARLQDRILLSGNSAPNPIFGSTLSENVVKTMPDSQDGEVDEVNDVDKDTAAVSSSQDEDNVLDSTESPVSEKESTSKVIETVFGDKDMSSSSASLPEFHHETGEENDKVVLQIQAKLFTFDKTTQSWKEKGRGLMSLNDICQSTSEGIFQSRLVMRMSGSRRVILNTNMWTEMKCERADSKRVRFTGQDIDTGQIRIFLVTGDTRSIGNLYSAMEKRLFAMRKSTGRSSDDSSDQESGRSATVSPTPQTSKAVHQDYVCDDRVPRSQVPVEEGEESLREDVAEKHEVDDDVPSVEQGERTAVIMDHSEENLRRDECIANRMIDSASPTS